MQEAIVIKNLSKDYYMNENSEKGFFKQFLNRNDKINIPALNDISLTVFRNETLGIIGDNGAGKTTLLKILSEITKPTFGTIDIYGKIASFLEIGVGFHPDLSGKENILFTASLMGVKNSVVKKNLNKIIEFSGIGKRIHTPVKFYSKGMKVKLAFSIISFIEADIIMFDEFIFIGEDYQFRQKIVERLESMYKKKTILYVSHYLEDIKSICDRALWLEKGKVIAIGDAKEIVNDYLKYKNG